MILITLFIFSYLRTQVIAYTQCDVVFIIIVPVAILLWCVCSPSLLRQMEFTYDTITHNIFMLHYLLSPCNLYLSVLIIAPNFNSMCPWNNISSCDQFEIKLNKILKSQFISAIHSLILTLKLFKRCVLSLAWQVAQL